MKKKISIEGMSCNHCVNHVKTALQEDIKGVNIIEVSLEGKYALVEIENSITDEEIINVISDLEFNVTNIETI